MIVWINYYWKKCNYISGQSGMCYGRGIELLKSSIVRIMPQKKIKGSPIVVWVGYDQHNQVLYPGNPD